MRYFSILLGIKTEYIVYMHRIELSSHDFPSASLIKNEIGDCFNGESILNISVYSITEINKEDFEQYKKIKKITVNKPKKKSFWQTLISPA